MSKFSEYKKGEKMISIATYGEISPSSLDILTRFHPLNERSHLEKTRNKVKEKETKPTTRGEADETKMKGVGDTKIGGRGGRGRGRIQPDCHESFIAGENQGLGYSGFGSLLSCGSTRDEASQDSFTANAVNDLSFAMKGVSMNEQEKKIKPRGRGRRPKE